MLRFVNTALEPCTSEEPEIVPGSSVTDAGDWRSDTRKLDGLVPTASGDEEPLSELTTPLASETLAADEVQGRDRSESWEIG